MAINKRLEIDIEVVDNSQIQNGDKLQLQINRNFSPLQYDNGNTKITKEFLKAGVVNVNTLVRFTDDNFFDNLGDFNNRVNTIEEITINGQTKFAVGGLFSSYTEPGALTSITVDKFVILNDDFTIFYNNLNLISNSLPSSTVSKIKYHSNNNSLIIVGRFEGIEGYPNVNHLFEFDLNTLLPSNNMSEWNTTNSIDGNALSVRVNDVAIRQSTGYIYFTGDFNTVKGNARTTLAAIRQDFSFPNETILDFNNRLSTYLTGFGNNIEVTQNGNPYIFVAGIITYNNPNATERNFSNLGIFNNFGVVTTDIKIPNLSGDGFRVKLTPQNDIYLYGNINTIGNYKNQTVMKLFPDGSVDDNFSIPLDGTVYQLNYSENYVYYFLNNNTSYYFIKSDRFTGEVKILYNAGGTPRDILVRGDEDLIITNLDSYEPDLSQADENKILVGATAQDTIDNILNSLYITNIIADDGSYYYSTQFANKIRIVQIITNDEDIYYLSNIIEETGVIEVNEVRNDSAFIPRISIAPIRSDVIIFGEENVNTTKTEFNLGELQDLIAGSDNILKITKQRLSESIQNSYLNMSRLIPTDNLTPNIEYFLDIGRNVSVQNSGHGRFYNNVSEGFNRDVNINKKVDVLYALDGYRYDKGKTKDKVLLNGTKRLVVRGGTIVIPFLSYQIDSINITSNNTPINITDSSFNLTDPTIAGEYISYLTLKVDSYFDTSKKINIEFNIDPTFLDVGEPTSYNVKIEIDDICTLYNPTRIIFKNSYGILEEIYFNGKIIDKLNTDNKEYKKSIYSTIGSNTKYNHLRKQYNKTPTREWDINTGNSYDYMNNAYEDLITSEEVWIEVNNEIKPVNLEDSNFQPKLDKADGVINYTFTFKEANDINQKLLS